MSPGRATEHKHPYFDATYLEHDYSRGIVRVIRQLISMIAADERFIDFKFIATPRVRSRLMTEFGIDPQRITTVRSFPLLGRFERFFGIFCDLRYRQVLKDANFIFHPEMRTVLFTSIHQAVLFYDFLFLEKPTLSGPRKIDRHLYFIYKTWKALRVPGKAAISEYTRSKALKRFRLKDASSFEVLHLGSRLPAQDRHAKSIDKRRPLEYLYVGSVETRKNVLGMLKNLRTIWGDYPSTLHLAGHLFPDQRELVESVLVECCLKENVVVHGEVNDTELNGLYAQADFFLFPSLAEGFGLPIIEAMSHGLVCCAFDNTTISEVGGDAIVLAPNGDFSTWGNSIRRLLANPDEYRALSESALKRSSNFSEEKMFGRFSRYILNQTSIAN